MKRFIVKSDAILLPSGPGAGYITAENGVITDVSPTPPTAQGEYIDATGYYVSAGFVDIHTHGGGGCDFMDGDAQSILTAARTHLRHGTTTIVPTTVAGAPEETLAFLDQFHAAGRDMADGPYLAGVHLEGPYFNPVRAGAQDPKYIKNPDPAEYRAIVDHARGAIIRWSVAPELAGALEMGDFLAKNGILPSIAHSDAVYDDVVQAYNHDYTLITHLYCGMSTISRKDGYRSLGVIESAYLIDDMDVEIIADGHHLPPELLRLVVKHKGPDRIALVTDSMRAAGMPEGESILGSLQNGQRVIVEGGVAKLMDRSAFAGSVATADQLVRVMVQDVGVSIPDAVKMMTSTPARILGLQRKKGSIAVNRDCDLVLFDDQIKLSAVITGGRVHSV